MRAISTLIITCIFAVSAISQGLVNNNAKISISTGTVLSLKGTSGNYVNNGTGTIDLSGTLDVQGDWTNNGSTAVFTGTDLTNGTIRFTGANSQVISGSASTTFENLTINKTDSFVTQTTSSITVMGDLYIQDGEYTHNNQSLILKGNWTNDDTYTPGTGTVEFSGTDQQEIQAGSSAFYNVTFNNPKLGFIDINVSEPMAVDGAATFTDGIVFFTGTGSMTFNNGASSDEGTATSFVNGPVTKIGTDAFTYAIGDTTASGTIWAPMAIGAPATSTTFTSRYFYEASTNWTNPSYMLDVARASGVEYWTLNRDAGTGTPGVTLYWKDSARSFITDLSDLRVVHYNTTPQWEDKGGTGVSQGGGKGYITSSIAFTDYSPITLGSKAGSNPLPVELINFNAECNAKNVTLKWATVSETNNSHFSIERSSDAITWLEISSVDGAGTSNTTHNYQYIDESASEGVSYYRIKQVDFSGTAKAYPVTVVSCDANVFEENIAIYPNPAANDLTISVATANYREAILQVSNVIGQAVIEQGIQLNKGNNNISINVSKLQNGTYYVNVITTDKIYKTQKLVVNR